MRIFSSFGIGRGLFGRGIEVVLIDQGVLRLPLLPAHVQLLPRHLLPDAVLHIVADPVTIELRRIWRNKTKHRRLEGEARFAKAGESLGILSGLPADELRAAMVQFGKQFCNPPFSDSEIDQLLSAPVGATPLGETRGSRSIRRCEPDACAALQGRGVRWKEIDNSRTASLADVVESCVQEVLAALGRTA